MQSAIENIYTAPTYYDQTYVSFIQDVLNTQISGRPYVDSIYIYYDEYPDRILTSPNGFVMFENFPDTDWLQEYTSRRTERLWASTRSISRYRFTGDTKEVITIFRKLFGDQAHGGGGVILLNIERDLIDNLMQEVNAFQHQEIYMFDQNDNLIISNQRDVSDAGTALDSIVHASEGISQIRIGRRRYQIFERFTASYGWRIVSAIPFSQLFALPTLLTKLFVFLIVVSIAIQITLTYISIRKNTEQIREITRLIESAESGLEVESRPKVIHDEYDIIVNSLIKTFLEQKYMRLQLSERKYRNMTLELQALRSQINPHFLFNTLESIYWMVARLSSGSNETSDMIKNLSEILKYSLEDTGQVFIEDEIRFAKSYLEIMKKRFRDRFTVEWDYDESIEGNVAIKMLLQPILENSIYHGIKDSPDTHKILISIVNTDEDLLITVSDDGTGIEPEDLDRILDSFSRDRGDDGSIGLYNCNRRIQLVFGQEYGITLRSTQPMPDDRKSGTDVLIRLPVTN